MTDIDDKAHLRKPVVESAVAAKKMSLNVLSQTHHRDNDSHLGGMAQSEADAK